MPSVSDEVFSAAAERLPSTPQVFERLGCALRDPDVGVEEISDIIRLDAALSARLLRLSNSAALGGAGTATNLNEAVQRVGFREVFRVVGGAMAAQLYIAGMPVYGVGGTELWENALAVALASEQLESESENARAAYTTGLLRSVGRLLLQRVAAIQTCPPMSGRKPTGALVLAWEQATFGLDSNEAAMRLFKLWKLSESFRDPLRFHFSPTHDVSLSLAPARLHLACWIAESLGKGLSIEKSLWTDDDRILKQAHVSRELLEQSTERTAKHLEELAELVLAA